MGDAARGKAVPAAGRVNVPGGLLRCTAAKAATLVLSVSLAVISAIPLTSCAASGSSDGSASAVDSTGAGDTGGTVGAGEAPATAEATTEATAAATGSAVSTGSTSTTGSAAATGTTGTTTQTGSTGTSTAADGSTVTVKLGKSDKSKHREEVKIQAKGGSFAGASNVSFEVTNTSDTKSSAFWVQANHHKDGTWSAKFDPETSGVGIYSIKGWATVGTGTVCCSETTYTLKEAFVFRNNISVGGGDYDVSYGMAGLKVQRIQQALGIGDYNYPRYLETTVTAVKSFQASHGLTETGTVDHETWLALGLDSMEWYSLGTYVSPVTVSKSATSSERIEAMIARANEYLGDTYVWDASGAPGQGIDCAGLVMQGLYAAGCDTGIINPVTHSTTAWGDRDAANYYSYGGFTKVNVNERSRGDLVFYGSSSNVDHVAIYLGGDQIIEAYPNTVRINSLWYRSIAGLRRVFC